MFRKKKLLENPTQQNNMKNTILLMLCIKTFVN